VIGRLQTEAELARQNPGKLVSSDNSLSVPSLPQNPSRVDRLVVESGREHARVFRRLFHFLRSLCTVLVMLANQNNAALQQKCGSTQRLKLSQSSCQLNEEIV